jgi:flagellar basal body-associated protein FliL
VFSSQVSTDISQSYNPLSSDAQDLQVDDSGLSGGVIAVIVIVVLLVVGLGSFSAYYFLVIRKRASGDDELSYA